MAYPTVDAPYGLAPVNLVGGQVYAGQVRHLPIAANEGTAIFFGDIVTLTAGTVRKVTTTNTTISAIGVFLGCTYPNPTTGQQIFSQFYPASTNIAGIKAYIQDDPDQLYKVVIANGTNTTAIGSLTQAAVGKNVALVQNAGSTATGRSGVAVVNSAATTTTLPLHIVDGVPETVNSSGSYTEVIVRFNFGMHMYNNAAGV
jgi:hypothetical protein